MKNDPMTEVVVRYFCKQVIAEDDPKTVEEGYGGAIQRLADVISPCDLDREVFAKDARQWLKDHRAGRHFDELLNIDKLAKNTIRDLCDHALAALSIASIIANRLAMDDTADLRTAYLALVGATSQLYLEAGRNNTVESLSEEYSSWRGWAADRNLDEQGDAIVLELCAESIAALASAVQIADHLDLSLLGNDLEPALQSIEKATAKLFADAGYISHDNASLEKLSPSYQKWRGWAADVVEEHEWQPDRHDED